MTDYKKTFHTPESKALPIVLLLDISYSMTQPPTKIDSLNSAISEMLDDLKQASGECGFVLSVITFGGQANCLYDPPYKNVKDVQWTELQVNGDTPLGTALKMAKAMIDDKDTTLTSWYRPVVILVSDGQPTDSSVWEKAMDDFITEGRSSKTQRLAMAIGHDADENVLKRFIKGTSQPLFYAHNARDIRTFFKMVSTTATGRSKQKDPNELTNAPPLDPSNSSNDPLDDFLALG